MLRIIVALQVCAAAHTASDGVPIVQLKLAPPKRPFPKLSDQVTRWDLEREGKETAFAKELSQAYDAALSDAKTNIFQLVKSAFGSTRVSFLEEGSTGSPLRVKVSVAESAHSPAVMGIVQAMEKKRSGLESQLIKQARAEMSALTSIVLEELEHNLRTLKRSPSFLEMGGRLEHGLPQQVAIRIQSSKVAFPRIADAIEEMEVHRDRAENVERKHILNLELDLLQAENQMITDALAGLA